MRFRLLFGLAIGGTAMWAPQPCLADWTKTIECPQGRNYRDVYRDAGRFEYCELPLAGALLVRDGPSRWWFSEGHPGEEGTYQAGRKIGTWRECDRFDRCHNQTYGLLYPQEKERGVKPKIPVWYARGKYTFDFHACWSTVVTGESTESPVDLNIYSGLIRCQISYTPATEKDRREGTRGYFCEIPYELGVREFDSLDLRKELPKVGLPQFCRQDEPPDNVRPPNWPDAQSFAIWGNTRFVDGATGKEAWAWETLANMVDVECAAWEQPPAGPARLTVRLNEYAERLVLQQPEIKASTCAARLPLPAIKATRDPVGRALFTYTLSQNRTIAGQQRECLAAQVKIQASCAAR